MMVLNNRFGSKRIHDNCKKELSRFSVDSSAVTASMGVTAIVPEDHSYKDTLKRADRALYDAKNGGKDRIVSA